MKQQVSLFGGIWKVKENHIWQQKQPLGNINHIVSSIVRVRQMMLNVLAAISVKTYNIIMTNVERLDVLQQ